VLAGGASKIASGGLAVAWLVSTIAIPLPGVPVLAGAGFVASVAITGATVAAWIVARRRALVSALRENRVVGFGLALLFAAYLLSAICTGAHAESLLGCARVAAMCIFAFAIVCANRDAIGVAGERALPAPFARAAAALLMAYAAAFVVGWFVPALRPYVFLTLPHQHLAELPRFAALTGSPGSTGAWGVLAIGLVGPLRRRWLRRGLRAAGALVALVTLSPATLVLPAVLAAALLRRRLVRVGVTTALIAAAIAPLYVHVLSIGPRGNEVTVSSLHPSYEESGLGFELMPIHDVSVLGVETHFHFTAYAALVVRAASCFAEHPLTGTGPKRFAEACPVVTMNTYGVWSPQRQAHNQFTELAVELGLLGLTLIAVGAWALSRGVTWEPIDRWSLGAAVGLVACSFSGALLLSLPAVGFFATQIRARDGGAR
jgi:hypothetical protein